MSQRYCKCCNEELGVFDDFARLIYCTTCRRGDCRVCQGRGVDDMVPSALKQTHHNCPLCGANHKIKGSEGVF